MPFMVYRALELGVAVARLRLDEELAAELVTDTGSGEALPLRRG